MCFLCELHTCLEDDANVLRLDASVIHCSAKAQHAVSFTYMFFVIAYSIFHLQTACIVGAD